MCLSIRRTRLSALLTHKPAASSIHHKPRVRPILSQRTSGWSILGHSRCICTRVRLRWTRIRTSMVGSHSLSPIPLSTRAACRDQRVGQAPSDNGSHAALSGLSPAAHSVYSRRRVGGGRFHGEELCDGSSP